MKISELPSLLGKRLTDQDGSLEYLRHELEGQLNALHHAALVSEMDANGNITFVNDRFVEVSGYPQDQLLGENHRILKSGQQPDELYEQMWATISAGSHWQGEICNRRRDGSTYWVIATISPVMDPQSGQPRKYIGVHFEITHQKEMEHELKQTLVEAREQGAKLRKAMEESQAKEDQLRMTMEEMEQTSQQLANTQEELRYHFQALNNAAIVSELDETGQIVYVNDTFCDISQYCSDELKGRELKSLKSEDQPGSTFQDMWETLQEGDVWRGFLKNLAKDGTPYWVHTTITPFMDRHEQPLRFIAVQVNVTSEMKKEERLAKQAATVEHLNASLESTREALEEQVQAQQDSLQASSAEALQLLEPLLAAKDNLDSLLPDSLAADVFFQPSGLVGGDFVWAGRHGEQIVLVLGDSTARGMAGAFHSNMAISLLTYLVEEQGVTVPSQLLEELNKSLGRVFACQAPYVNQSGSDHLDMAVLTLSPNKRPPQLALANRPALLLHADGREEILSHTAGVVGHPPEAAAPAYQARFVEMDQGDTLCLFSDGFAHQVGADQAGGAMGQDAFVKLLKDVSTTTAGQRRQVALKRALQAWKGEQEQTDDISILMLTQQS